jgi:hypothetical protein
VQFCQQCGQPLAEVRKVIEEGAALLPPEVASFGPTPAVRRKGVRQGFKLVLLALLVLPFYPLVETLLRELIPSVENTRLDELPLELFGTLILTLFLAGLARMLYAFLFEGKAEQAPAEKPAPVLPSEPERQALPPSHSIPAADFASRRVRTDELPRPRTSVTEHTTRGLRRE